MIDLKQFHTRELLCFLSHARACGGGYDITDNHSSWAYVTIEELKTELATREHVPNKQERRKIRQEKARRK